MLLWKRNSRCLGIILSSSFILVIFLTSLVSAQNISANYPSNVRFDEEFNFEVNLDNYPEDSYDVKIDIVVDNKRVANIFDGGKFKSTYYYVIDAIEGGNGSNVFKMKIVENINAKGDINIKIRDSKGVSNSFTGYEINIESVGVDENINNGVDNENSENEEQIEEDEEENITVNQIKSEEEIKNETDVVAKKSEDGVIRLTPKSIKKPENNKTVFESGNEKIKKYTIYAFALFCVIIIVLLIIDRYS